MPKTHTGDAAKIREWFQNNPTKEITSLELAKIFGLERWQVNNALSRLQKKNVITGGTKFNIGTAHYTPFRLRHETEPRNEFKITNRAAMKANLRVIKEPEREAPVLTEIEIDRLDTATKRILNALYGKEMGRIQALNPTTFIAWNSREHLVQMRRNALGI